MSPDERTQRAVGVRALLDDPNVKDAFASIERDLMDEWKACKDQRGRENLWLSIQNIERLKTWLISASGWDLRSLKRQK